MSLNRNNETEKLGKYVFSLQKFPITESIVSYCLNRMFGPFQFHFSLVKCMVCLLLHFKISENIYSKYTNTIQTLSP